jgi:tetratricopeptide (TPR) repeat protein
MSAKVKWSSARQNWQMYTKSLIEYIERYWSEDDLKSAYFMNNACWKIFLYSKNRNELKIALKWMKRIVEEEPSYAFTLDTYANLFYKLGDDKQALILERKCMQMDPNDEFVKENIQKIKMHKPTWTITK